jgi:predicted secreted protein
MFEDQRSRRVLLVAHCVLNQNAKIDRCAYYPGVIKEAVEALIESGVGLIQMPCPELLCLGLDRQAVPDAATTIESEDTRVARLMAADENRTICRSLADALVVQIEHYQRNSFEVIGLLGINGSPTCGIEISWVDDHEEPHPGSFIQLLNDACHAKGITLRQRGIRAREPHAAVAAVRDLLTRPVPLVPCHSGL